MFARYLFIDDVRRPPSQIASPGAGAIRDPEWKDIVQAVERFDAINVRMIVIGEEPPSSDMPSDGRFVVIGRQTTGPKFTYHMYVPDDRSMHVLVDPSQPPGIECEVLVGQHRTEDLRFCVPIDLLLTGLKRFYEIGNRDPSLVWEAGEY